MRLRLLGRAVALELQEGPRVGIEPGSTGELTAARRESVLVVHQHVSVLMQHAALQAARNPAESRQRRRQWLRPGLLPAPAVPPIAALDAAVPLIILQPVADLLRPRDATPCARTARPPSPAARPPAGRPPPTAQGIWNDAPSSARPSPPPRASRCRAGLLSTLFTPSTPTRRASAARSSPSPVGGGRSPLPTRC